MSCLVHLCTHWRPGQALEVREWCLGLGRVGGVVDFFPPLWERADFVMWEVL